MSMLTLNGTVLNTYVAPKGTNKDGEEYGGNSRIQLLCENTLKNGEIKQDLIDLNLDDADKYAKGEIVSIPVGVYVVAGQAKFYALK
jgi:hypothetical protein